MNRLLRDAFPDDGPDGGDYYCTLGETLNGNAEASAKLLDINELPRETLQFDTPAERLMPCDVSGIRQNQNATIVRFASTADLDTAEQTHGDHCGMSVLCSHERT